MSDMEATTSSPGDDIVQVSQARQAAVIKALQQQLDDIQANEGKPKKKAPQKASTTIPSAVPVVPLVPASEGMDPLNLLPSDEEFKDAIEHSSPEEEEESASRPGTGRYGATVNV